jgi:hypothetical protein
MTVFIKVKKLTFLLKKLYGFTKIKDDRSIIRCAVKFYINMINTIVVWWQFFPLKMWTKVRIDFFFLILNFLILVLFQGPPASKNGRSFHGEVVTFISVIDGIRGIFEAQFIMQLCF